jgi:hypothetical protein
MKKMDTYLLILILIVLSLILFKVFYKSDSYLYKNNESEFKIGSNNLDNLDKSSSLSQFQINTSSNYDNLEDNIVKNGVSLNLSQEISRMYKTKLSDSLSQPANFNKHYVVTTIGCGSGCELFLIVDKNTGDAFKGPSNDWGNVNPNDLPNDFSNYSIDSNFIRTVKNDGSIASYKFDGAEFILQTN